MKRTLLLLLILLLLGGIAWYTINKNNVKDNMPVSNSLYAIDDISRVYTAGIIYPNGRKVKLEKTNAGWLYNGKKANIRTVNTMLNTVKKLRVLYATPEAAKENILKSLATNKVKIELYDKNNKPLQIFYMGAPGNDGNSTYFIKEGSNEPHLVGVPGFTGTIGINFKRPEADWIDKTIIAIPTKKVQTVSVEYPNLKSRSFKFEQKDNGFDVIPFYSSTPKINGKHRLGSDRTFTSFFNRIEAEAVLSEKLIDSLNNLVPFATLQVKTTEGQETTIHFHPFIPEGVDGLDNLPSDDRDPNSPIGTNRYYALVDNRCLLTQHRVVGKILWAYWEFFEKKQSS